MTEEGLVAQLREYRRLGDEAESPEEREHYYRLADAVAMDIGCTVTPWTAVVLAVVGIMAAVAVVVGLALAVYAA